MSPAPARVRDLYFAYGSNMSSRRLRARVPEARAIEPAHLPGRLLALNKRGRDGSAKANLVDAPDARVWGVLYELAVVDWERLDPYEGGYERVRVEVVRAGGGIVEAGAYVSTRITPEPVVYDWYRELLLEGAREHGLPDDYQALLAALPTRPDPRR